MMQTVAALTIMRDDAFALKAWLRHYGGQIGRENCYLISDGTDPGLVAMAQGCSIIRLPEGFARRRGRILNNFVAALRCYFTHVIVGDPADLVVVDPQAGGNLRVFLETVPKGRVLTPLGLEVIRSGDGADGDTILNPHCHLRPAPQLSKPCIISIATSLSSNGRFARYKKLFTPDALYLLNLRHCGPSTNPPSPPPAARDLQDGFDFAPMRARMHDSWQRRGTSGYWNFDLPRDDTQYLLPERFHGLF